VPSGKAMVTFSSNYSVNAKGFELNYKGTTTTTGIENEAVEALTVYPNPASSDLNLSFFIHNNDHLNIEIYNITGQNIYQECLPDFVGSYHKTINIESLSQGIYFLKVTSSNGVSVKKIIVN
jgi:hypothetical protein